MTEESSSTAESTAGKRPTSRLKAAGIAAAVTLLIVFVVLVAARSNEGEFTWLSPAQFTQNTKPGRFTVLKWKVKSLTAPIWSRFHKPVHICVEGKLLMIRDGGIEKLGVGAPGTTNADGLCAWFLQPNDSQLFRAQIKTNSAVTIGNGSAILTGSGGQATVFNMTSGAPTTPQTGTKIDVLPKYSAGTFKLILSVSATDRVMSNTNSPTVQTNLDAACQFTIADGGSVLLGKRPANNGTNYFMLISATAQDAKGNRIRR